MCSQQSQCPVISTVKLRTIPTLAEKKNIGKKCGDVTPFYCSTPHMLAITESETNLKQNKATKITNLEENDVMNKDQSSISQ